MNNIKVFLNGLIKENPTFVLLLGTCPTLGTTSSALNGMSMGLATMAVLVFSNFIIALIKNLIPDMVRIPCYIVVIASLVTILQMLIKAYAPGVDAALGLFIPLIVVNCIIWVVQKLLLQRMVPSHPFSMVLVSDLVSLGLSHFWVLAASCWVLVRFSTLLVSPSSMVLSSLC